MTRIKTNSIGANRCHSRLTSDRFALVKTSVRFFAEAVVIFVKNGTVRQNIHG